MGLLLIVVSWAVLVWAHPHWFAPRRLGYKAGVFPPDTFE